MYRIEAMGYLGLYRIEAMGYLGLYRIEAMGYLAPLVSPAAGRVTAPGGSSFTSLRKVSHRPDQPRCPAWGVAMPTSGFSSTHIPSQDPTTAATARQWPGRGHRVTDGARYPIASISRAALRGAQRCRHPASARRTSLCKVRQPLPRHDSGSGAGIGLPTERGRGGAAGRGHALGGGGHERSRQPDARVPAPSAKQPQPDARVAVPTRPDRRTASDTLRKKRL